MIHEISASRQPKVSLVFPVYNERENLDALVSRVHPVLESACHGSFEVIFVDDGSRDGSSEWLDDINARDTRYKTIHFSRNFGHQAALQAGLDAARGSGVVLMDADLQDPPELLSTFIEKWLEGYDVVYAVRKKRKEPAWKRFAYLTFYRTMSLIAEIDTPLDAGDFCLMDRRVVDTLVGLRERNRFLRGLRSWVGFKQIGIEYDRYARNAGEPKYTLRKLIALALSGYIGFSSMPLRLAAWLGVTSATAGFFLAIWVVLSKLIVPHVPQGWASIIAAVLLASGVQLIILGIIGEYLGRVYNEVRQRPLYVVSSTAGLIKEQKDEKLREAF
ncbi:MAG TPA: glycosyltransferase family 2 protein [Pyrinomonadaceae bacterium]|nr:glycosyltransferase family 2 protein [Pyrinomonadaceae bacterium]